MAFLIAIWNSSLDEYAREEIFKEGEARVDSA